jgi:drug/metabolite transporter (DMT)-like permease
MRGSAEAFNKAAEPDLRRGYALGVLGVVIFALSIPMTRLASGSSADPQLPPMFVAFGRAAVAGVCSLIYLRAVGAGRAASADFWPLAFTALGVVIGWPVFLGLAVREVEAAHASVIAGILPLVTAMMAAWWLRQRHSTGFWGAALVGCALVVVFALWRGWQQSGELRISWADLLLIGAVISAAAGYVSGAGLSARMPPEQVICWVLVLSLPLTIPVTLATLPVTPIRFSAWAGFAYLSIFSMWLGFFAWYRALAIGGTVRISQVQLLQPFLSLLFCVPILGESLDAMTAGFSLAIIATVLWSRHYAKPRPAHE